MSPLFRILALPLMLLALLVQGLTPAVAAEMTARMADPFASMPICSAGAVAGDPGAPAQDHRQLCQACSICFGPAAAITPDAPTLTAPIVVRIAARPRVEIAGPRGPPALSPRARGPPALS